MKQADAARNAEQWDTAIELYGKVVKLRPTYTEGVWYQGVAYYSLDRFTECRDAFRRVTRVTPKNGPAFAFLGLCEFGLETTIVRCSTWRRAGASGSPTRSSRTWRATTPPFS